MMGATIDGLPSALGLEIILKDAQVLRGVRRELQSISPNRQCMPWQSSDLRPVKVKLAGVVRGR